MGCVKSGGEGRQSKKTDVAIEEEEKQLPGSPKRGPLAGFAGSL